MLSRIDGKLTIRDVLLMTGLPVDRAVAIVSRLRSIGAVLLPNESEPPPQPRSQGTGPTPTAPPRPSTSQPIRTQPRPPSEQPLRSSQAIPRVGTPHPAAQAAHHPAAASIAQGRRPTGGIPVVPQQQQQPAPPSDELPAMPFDLTLPNMSDDERSALGERVEITEEDRRRILAMARLVAANNPHALLGVPTTADARLLKRVYFRLSKEIHPDRYYGMKLGTFGDRMTTVFEAVSRAYNRLINPQPDASRQSSSNLRTAEADKPQTTQEYAAELYSRATTLEVNGNPLEAMRLFAAAVRVDPQPRYMRRAATCALAAGQPKTAVEYAKKAHADAPDDVSTARLLAQAFKAASKLADAEEVLVMAMAMKSENDVLTSELRRDLADVRRLLATQ